MPKTLDTRILLRADGVALLLDLSAGQLPAVLHWRATRASTIAAGSPWPY